MQKRLLSRCALADELITQVREAKTVTAEEFERILLEALIRAAEDDFAQALSKPYTIVRSAGQ